VSHSSTSHSSVPSSHRTFFFHGSFSCDSTPALAVPYPSGLFCTCSYNASGLFRPAVDHCPYVSDTFFSSILRPMTLSVLFTSYRIPLTTHARNQCSIENRFDRMKNENALVKPNESDESDGLTWNTYDVPDVIPIVVRA